MINVSLTVDPAGMARILAGLEALAGPDQELIRLIADAVAQDGALPRITGYPPQSRAAQPFKTTAQRRAFFARLRAGAIAVPYRRTYALRAGWRDVPTPWGASVRNDVPYAGLVQGEPGQQGGYFAGNWLSVAQVAQETEAQAAPGLAAGAVTLWIAKKGLG